MSHDTEAIAIQLRSAGYRMTPQRQLILDALCALGGHVSPEEVYGHVHTITPTLNRATVYRTLNFFSEQGIITATQTNEGHLTYELAGPKPHHHLICRRCGASIELSHELLGQFYQTIEAQHGFAIGMWHVTFYGLCAQCA